MEKTMKVFDSTLITVGACSPNSAKLFGYRAIM